MVDGQSAHEVSGMTYQIKYENGAEVKTVTAHGDNICEAIRNLGFAPNAFMRSRLIEWKEQTEQLNATN